MVYSVDAFIQREKYLKGTYESLSGIEMEMKHNSEYQGLCTNYTIFFGND